MKEGQYADNNPAITSKSRVGQMFTGQTSFNDDKYADPSPVSTKSSIARKIVSQTSFKDDKFANNSPLIMAKSNAAPQVVRQTSFNRDDNYTNISDWQKFDG